MNRRSGLGRGLAALIPPSPEDTPEFGDSHEDGAAAGAGGDHAAGEAAPAPSDPTADHPGGDLGIRQEQQPESFPEHDRGVGSVTRHGDEPGDQGTGGLSGAGVASSTTPLPAPTVPAETAQLLDLPLTAITPNPRQPREIFDPEELEGLATSLADVGMLQPLVVRPAAGGGYELVAGERRLRAAELAGLSTVPAVLRHTEDAALLKEALVENIHRVQLNPLEEAAAYQQLLEEFGVTQDELAGRLGRSRSAIANTIRLLRLPSAVQRRVAAGVLSAGHARAVLALDDPGEQTRLAERIVAEGLSVRDVEELVRLRLTDDAPAGRSSPRRRNVDAPGLVELQDDLSDALQTRVRISMGARTGRLAIDFASVDDLERIVNVIANGLGTTAGAGDPVTQAAGRGITSGVTPPGDTSGASTSEDGDEHP